VVPTLLGILPYSGLKFYTYQKLKRMWLNVHHPAERDTSKSLKQLKPPVLMTLLFGAVAGIVGQTFTYPLDIVRRRMQVQGVVGHIQLSSPASSAEKSGFFGGKAGRTGVVRASMWATLQEILREHGYLGLFRGLSINYIKVVPSTAIGFTAYEQIKHVLGLENHL
jgi:hypothetical protein